MEVVTGALPSLIAKLGELLVGEYNMQKGMKGEIRFLQAELESMQGALEKVSNTPVDRLDIQDKIWARDLRDLSYDIEDSIDAFMVRGKGNDLAELHGIRKFIDRSVGLFRKAKARHKIASEIRGIKKRVDEVSKRRDRYMTNTDVAKPVIADPRLLAHFKEAAELVGIDEARDELVNILMERNQLSIFGFGGLGKTTLANVLYEKLRAQFDCWAFVSVSQSPDMKKLFKRILYELHKNFYEGILHERQLINQLREFLQEKRYFIVIDDIWDITVWKMIRCGMPDNNCGYKIITTTRVSHIAEQIGGAYKMKPLSLRNSRILFYNRIFGCEYKGNNKDNDKCPDQQLLEVSDKILDKCAGVPLAIITIASLLASKGRNKIEWYNVYNSIGTGLQDNSLDVKQMRKILSLSYYDMPFHLRSCLLYLTVFQEDYKIQKGRLIRLWIAEGFVQHRKGRGLFLLGETYFNELISRSMIQPVYDGYGAMVQSCHIHDMVLDLIHSLSREENFVTLLNNVDHRSPSKKIRRLSLQHNKVDPATPWANVSMEQVRSVIVFPSAFHLMPALTSFRVVRVLDFQDCDLSQGCNLKYLSNLFHLRYLGLNNTCIPQLPEEIGNLTFLQSLDIKNTKISSLPSTIVQLQHLMSLRIDWDIGVPNRIGRLTSLEELSTLYINESMNIIEELGHLSELRALDCEIKCNNTVEKSFVQCLCKLQKIQSLSILVVAGECNLDSWVAPRHLRRLVLTNCWFSKQPAWMNPSLLLKLSFLRMCVIKLQQEDLKILGKLPALRYLGLRVDHENLGIRRRFFVGACSFPCLVWCELKGFRGSVVFQQGAMPRLTSLEFSHTVWVAKEITDSNGGFDIGLGNLPSLQHVEVTLQSEGATEGEVVEVKDALRHAAEIHPNRPTLQIW